LGQGMFFFDLFLLNAILTILSDRRIGSAVTSTLVISTAVVIRL
jgi:hypothetical protein